MKLFKIILAAVLLIGVLGFQALGQGFTEQQILNFAYMYDTQVAYTDGGLVEYVGKASPGTATSATGWQIQKISYGTSDEVTGVTFANDSAAFDKVWTSRTTYSY